MKVNNVFIIKIVFLSVLTMSGTLQTMDPGYTNSADAKAMADRPDNANSEPGIMPVLRSTPGAVSIEAQELQFAAETGNEAEVRRLIELGVDINWKNERGATPLLFAVQNEHVTIAQILLNHKANVNVQVEASQNVSALELAAKTGQHKMTQLLLDHGARVDVTDSRGITPLIFAAQNGHYEVVRTLLRNGASAAVQALGFGNISALRQAAQNGHFEIVVALLTYPPSAEILAIQKRYFALHGSMRRRGINIPKDLRILIADHFIEASAQECMDNIKHTDKVKHMISLRDDTGYTARGIASFCGKQKIADLLDLDDFQPTEEIRVLIESNMRHAINGDIKLC